MIATFLISLRISIGIIYSVAALDACGSPWRASHHSVRYLNGRHSRTLPVIPAGHSVIPAQAGIHDDGLVKEKAPFVYIMASKR
ncbi:MAG: hypothetical protein ABIU97_08040, partial [Dehalococcoidia bacterium]